MLPCLEWLFGQSVLPPTLINPRLLEIPPWQQPQLQGTEYSQLLVGLTVEIRTLLIGVNYELSYRTVCITIYRHQFIEVVIDKLLSNTAVLTAEPYSVDNKQLATYFSGMRNVHVTATHDMMYTHSHYEGVHAKVMFS